VVKKKQPMYKFLGPNLGCVYDRVKFYYPAPTYDAVKKRWTPTPWLKHPKPDHANKAACGVGFHLAKVCAPRWGRYSGNAYLAEGRKLLGEDEEKARFAEIRLLRPLAFEEIFHPKATLSRATLSGADLSGAYGREDWNDLVKRGARRDQ